MEKLRRDEKYHQTSLPQIDQARGQSKLQRKDSLSKIGAGTGQLPKVPSTTTVPQTKPDLDEQAERFKKYFANLDKDRLTMLEENEEEVMGKTSNLEGLDLEISQPRIDDRLLVESGSVGKSDMLLSLNLQTGAEK